MELYKKNRILFTLTLISFLLIGADRISISLYGFTFRIVQIILLVMYIFLFLSMQYRIDHRSYLLFFPLLFIHLISVIISFNLLRSIGYTVWLFLNFIIVYIPISVLTFSYEEDIKSIYTLIFNLCGYATVLQFLLGLVNINIPFLYTNYFMNIPRPALWFYEPSYLATFLTIYFSISIWNYFTDRNKKNLLKVFKSGIFILFTTSLSGVLGMFFAIGFAFLFSKSAISVNKIKEGILFCLLVVLVGVSIYMINPDIFELILGRLIHKGLESASGERIKGMKITYDVIKDNIWLGIGPGSYSTVFGFPPTNVTLEIIVSLGLFGFIISIFWFGFPFYLLMKHPYAMSPKPYVFAYFIFLLTLQANQNYLRLYHWQLMGLIGGMYYAHVKMIKKR